MIINMNEKKVREAIEYLSGYIQSNINLMEKIEGIVWIGEDVSDFMSCHQIAHIS